MCILSLNVGSKVNSLNLKKRIIVHTLFERSRTLESESSALQNALITVSSSKCSDKQWDYAVVFVLLCFAGGRIH